MTPATPERAPETFFEKIVSVPKRILGYIWEHPVRSVLNFMYITAGLAGLRHLGVFNNIPATGGWGYLRTALDTPARWSQTMYNTGLERLGTNIGGYPGWVSGPAQTFSNATRNLFGPAAPPHETIRE